MAHIKFAFTVENEVFHVTSFDETNITAQKWIAALRSNISFACSTDYEDVHQHWTYLNDNFYTPDDTNKQTPITKVVVISPETNRYAGIIDGEVIGFITFVKSELPTGMFEMIHAAMISNPIPIEIPEFSLIDVGDTFDGNNFNTTVRG